MTSDLQHQAKRLADDAERYLRAMHRDKCDPDSWHSIRVETAIEAVRRALIAPSQEGAGDWTEAELKKLGVAV